jgi:hypothetical protein
MPDVVAAALRSDDPGAGGPRRIVADVLVVAALQFGYPVIVFVLMKPDDFAFGHEGLCHFWSMAKVRR